MSCEFIDSFDHYNTSDELVAKWTTANGCTLGPGRNGQGLVIGTSALKSLKLQQQWYVGFAMNVEAATGFGPIEVVYATYNVGTVMGTLSIAPDGSLALWAGNGFNPSGPNANLICTTLTTSPLPFYIHPNQWYYVEIAWTIGSGNNANVSGTIRVNGVQLCTGSAPSQVNTNGFIVPNSGTNVHQWFNIDIFGNVVIDDLYIFDNAGEFNNTFAGDVKLGVLYPLSDITTQWTGLIPGNQYSQINSQFPVGDSSYVYATAPAMGSPSIYDNFNWQQANPAIGQIFVVQYLVYARKDDEGTREIQQFCGTPGSIHAGALSPVWSLGDTYLYYYYDMDVDPATQTSWTVAGFNASQFGFQLVG